MRTPNPPSDKKKKVKRKQNILFEFFLVIGCFHFHSLKILGGKRDLEKALNKVKKNKIKVDAFN